MRNFIPTHKLDKASEAGGGSGNEPEKQQEDAEVDDLGYAKPAPEAGEKGKEGDSEKKDPAEAEVKDPATGYDKAPEKVEDPAPDPKTDDKKPEPDEFDKVLVGLSEDEIVEAKDFATKHKLSVEQIKAYGDLRKVRIAADEQAQKDAQKNFENEKLKIRASWHKELKEDRDFGGGNFEANVSKAEKVLAEFMPSTKKSLTERKAMLPPYVMRDLAKLADTLYATGKLVHGEPKAAPAPKTDIDEALDFYNS